jgi:cytochrome P450
VGNIFGKLAIMIGKTSLIKDALNQMNKLQKNPFISEIFQNLNGGGIAFTEGDAWKRKRKIISSVFHYDFLNDLIPVIEEEINLRYSEIDFGISRGEKQVDLRNVFTKILSNVVAKCFFGTDMKDYLVEDKPYCEYFLECLNDLGLWIGSWEHMLLRMKGFNIGLTKTSR